MNYQTREKRPPTKEKREAKREQSRKRCGKSKRPIFLCGYTNKHVAAR